MYFINIALYSNSIIKLSLVINKFGLIFNFSNVYINRTFYVRIVATDGGGLSTIISEFACKVVERTLAKFNVEYEHPMSIETVDGVQMKAMAANDFHLKNGGRISVADGLQVEDFRVQEIVKLS